MRHRPKHSGPRDQARSSPSVQLIYGVHAATAALTNPARRIAKVHVSRNMADRLAAQLGARGVSPSVVHPRDLDRIAGQGAVHQGIIVETAPLPETGIEDIASAGPLIILDQVTDPHNVGAILRSAAAFSAAALVTTSRHSPDATGVLAKAASGALEHVPIVRVTNLARTMRDVAGLGYTIIGLDSAATNDLESLPVSGPYAIVLGAEGKGLRRLTRETCDYFVRLDLPGQLKSLNVSNAAALALYALNRKS